MKLRPKVRLIVGLTWLLIVLVIIGQSYYFTLQDYLAMERGDVHDIYIRNQEAIKRSTEGLSAFTGDWAHWNDSLKFIKEKYDRFIVDNLNSKTTFKGVKLNYILYYDNNGQFYKGRAFNLQTNEFVPVTPLLLKKISNYPQLTQHNNSKSSVAGFIKGPENLIMIASYPLANSQLNNNAAGRVIMGYDLNSARTALLAKTLQIRIKYHNLFQIETNPKLIDIYTQLEHGAAYVAYPVNDKQMHIYSKVLDINKNPIGMFIIDMHRTTYLLGLNSIHRSIFTVIITGIIILILLEFLLQWSVLNRLFNFRKTLNEITLNGDFTRRIPVTGNDEIADLIKDSNNMLKVINISLMQSLSMVYNIVDANHQLNIEINARQAAEKQLQTLNTHMMIATRQAGMADIATSVLHNVGNALNSIITSTHLIEYRIKQTDSEDLVSIASLLNKNREDLVNYLLNDDKGKKIPEFLVMLANKIQKNKTYSEQELVNLMHNIDHIKHVITAQEDFSTSTVILQQCNLSEVVDEALFLCKYSLEADNIIVLTEYATIPLAIIDRIKLLQILVIIIKNANEALLGNAIDNRQLTIKIQPVDDNQCIIEIIDNGAEIEDKYQSQRFSCEFPTQENGQSFGLYTCALAAEELGGQLTVTSLGISKGAIFTLILPYELKKSGGRGGRN